VRGGTEGRVEALDDRHPLGLEDSTPELLIEENPVEAGSPQPIEVVLDDGHRVVLAGAQGPEADEQGRVGDEVDPVGVQRPRLVLDHAAQQGPPHEGLVGAGALAAADGQHDDGAARALRGRGLGQVLPHGWHLELPTAKGHMTGLHAGPGHADRQHEGPDEPAPTEACEAFATQHQREEGEDREPALGVVHGVHAGHEAPHRPAGQQPHVLAHVLPGPQRKHHTDEGAPQPQGPPPATPEPEEHAAGEGQRQPATDMARQLAVEAHGVAEVR